MHHAHTHAEDLYVGTKMQRSPRESEGEKERERERKREREGGREGGMQAGREREHAGTNTDKD